MLDYNLDQSKSIDMNQFKNKIFCKQEQFINFGFYIMVNTYSKKR